MTRKGMLEEVFSKALYADNPDLYSVSYRDFDSIIEVPLPEFIRVSENFELIPSNRIFEVKKGQMVLYHKYLPTTTSLDKSD
ncbi:MAG: DUF504 domain-containing protein [Nitrososphaeraceae archaeon]|nr:DUF504 domain-containing protein [Nitrososphaeraceae archaeon]